MRNDDFEADTPDWAYVRAFLVRHLGPIAEVVPCTEGIVHHVYRIDAASQTAFLKMRGYHFAGVPSVKCTPQDIVYEERATKLLSALLPDTFPHLVAADQERGMLLTTNVMSGHRSLRVCFEQGQANSEMLYAMGETLGRVHKLSAKSKPIRGDQEQQAYDENLFFRLGYHRHTVLDQLIVQMSHLPKQLILGDFSPKNIGVSEDYHVSLYDLDAVHHGNAVFDVGFFIGHILVHTLGKHPDLISGFLDGYREYADLVGNHLLTQLALGICLYRLANPTIPYTLAMDERQRSCLIDTIHILLGYSLLSWTATCQELARSGQGEVWHSPSTLDRL